MEVCKSEGEAENGNRRSEKRDQNERRRCIFTYLWTLSHLLTFSQDVVCHHHKRRVSLSFRIKRRTVLQFFLLMIKFVVGSLGNYFQLHPSGNPADVASTLKINIFHPKKYFTK